MTNTGRTQRWRCGRARWVSGGDALDPRRYRAIEVPHRAAPEFVLTHHYSGSYPADRLWIGLVDRTDDSLVGVAVLAVPPRKAVLTGVFPDLTPYTESLELARFVLLDAVPPNGESWFLGRVFAASLAHGLRGLVAFSDPMPRRALDGTLVVPGHVGYIYQATNAIYTGRGTARRLLVLPDGRTLNARALAKLRAGHTGHAYVMRLLVHHGARPPAPREPVETWLPRALAEADVRTVAHPGCHRYAFPLGATARSRRSVVVRHAGAVYPKAVDATAA